MRRRRRAAGNVRKHTFRPVLPLERVLTLPRERRVVVVALERLFYTSSRTSPVPYNVYAECLSHFLVDLIELGAELSYKVSTLVSR